MIWGYHHFRKPPYLKPPPSWWIRQAQNGWEVTTCPPENPWDERLGPHGSGVVRTARLEKLVQNSQLTGAPSTKVFFDLEHWLGTFDLEHWFRNLTWNIFIEFLKMKTRSQVTSCFCSFFIAWSCTGQQWPQNLDTPGPVLKPWKICTHSMEVTSAFWARDKVYPTDN